MSLDVYLTGGEIHMRPARIFIRECGGNVEISREEWDRRFPDREPVTVVADESNEAYSANITHNLTKMASEAGLYYPLWRPEEMGATKAKHLIQPLRNGLGTLRASPDYFAQFNPANGWGSYEGFVEFARNYLEACEANPMADVRVWR